MIKHVVVAFFQRSTRRQNNIGKTGRFVEIGVDRHIEFQCVKRLFRVMAIGHGEHHIPRQAEQPTHLALPWRHNLFTQNGHWEFPRKLGPTSHTRTIRIPAGLGQGQRFNSRLREHHAADLVHIASDHVHDLHQPLSETRKLHHRHSRTPITDSTVGTRKFFCNTLYVATRDASDLSNPT